MANEDAKIKKIKDFLEGYSAFNEGMIKVDYLNSKVYSYAIETTPSNPIVKSYVDGKNLKQLTFDFFVLSPTSKDSIIALKNSKFFDDFSSWINSKDINRELPDIPGAFGIECTSPGYIIERNNTTAEYVIQMAFYYYE